MQAVVFLCEGGDGDEAVARDGDVHFGVLADEAEPGAVDVFAGEVVFLDVAVAVDGLHHAFAALDRFGPVGDLPGEALAVVALHGEAVGVGELEDPPAEQALLEGPAAGVERVVAGAVGLGVCFEEERSCLAVWAGEGDFEVVV